MSQIHRLFLVMILLIMYGCSSRSRLEPGSAAPDFDLQAVRGGSYQLSELSGQVVLLSFINTQAEAGATTTDPSRAQIVFLKSMQEQFGSKGLVVVIIDAARIVTGSHPSVDQLINFTYDWQLDDVLVLDDPEDRAAKAYNIKSTPTTFLIDTKGVVQQRWDGFASASQLALSIEPLVGAPAHRQVDTSEIPASPAAAVCTNETQPQARFAGVGLARPLSDELWVVDGGQAWATNVDFPVQWILLDTQKRSTPDAIHLQVLGEYTDTQQTVVLSDGTMELLAAEVASGLLSGNAKPAPIYSLVTTFFLERPGCLKVRATVTHEGTTVPLYQSSLIISAR